MTAHGTLSDSFLDEALTALEMPVPELLRSYLEESPQRFEGLMRELAARLQDRAVPGEVAARDDGAFSVDGCTVVLRRNPDNDYIEIFCDVGQPKPHDEHATYRAALELNLCRTYPGLTLGVHPQSGRIVATLAAHSLLIRDVDTCLQILDLLTVQVQRIRESRVLALADEGS